MIYTALDTFYVTAQQIADSPSRKDGVDESTESLLRRFGCELIQESGILLKMPQAVMATGQVLFHRFYCKKSFARFNVKRVAASCVWLAAKLEESPRKMRDVLNVFHRIDGRRENGTVNTKEFIDAKKYEEMKTDLIRTERHLLKEMGFICHVEHPHKFILNYLLQLEAPPELMQEAWNLANDSLRTILCVRFKSEVVACGVVYAAARRFKVPLPEDPPWWRVFDAEKKDIEEVCRVLGDLYRQPKAHYMEVRKDAKSFVLTSTAWDPPPDVQCTLLKAVTNGNSASQPQNSSSPDGREANCVKGSAEQLKALVVKESREDNQETQTSAVNGEFRDDLSAGKAKAFPDREDGSATDKSRDKDRVRLKEYEKDRERDRERDKERDRARDRDRERDREKEREREKLKERDHRNKDRSRDAGHHSDKLRHHSSSRDRGFQNSHTLIREKERHRYHPYV